MMFAFHNLSRLLKIPCTKPVMLYSEHCQCTETTEQLNIYQHMRLNVTLCSDTHHNIKEDLLSKTSQKA